MPRISWGREGKGRGRDREREGKGLGREMKGISDRRSEKIMNFF